MLHNASNLLSMRSSVRANARTEALAPGASITIAYSFHRSNRRWFEVTTRSRKPRAKIALSISVHTWCFLHSLVATHLPLYVTQFFSFCTIGGCIETKIFINPRRACAASTWSVCPSVCPSVTTFSASTRNIQVKKATPTGSALHWLHF